MRRLIGSLAASGDGAGRWLLYCGLGGYFVERWDRSYSHGTHRQGGWNVMPVSTRHANRIAKHKRFTLHD